MTAEIRDIKTAGAYQEITMAAIEQLIIDPREIVRADLSRKLSEVIGIGAPVSEIEFFEEKFVRTVGIYADDADWDDADLEPIGYEDVPMLAMRARQRFIPAADFGNPPVPSPVEKKE